MWSRDGVLAMRTQTQQRMKMTHVFWWSLTRFLSTVICEREMINVIQNEDESPAHNFSSFSCQSKWICGNRPKVKRGVTVSLLMFCLLSVTLCSGHTITSYFWCVCLYCRSNCSPSSCRSHFHSSSAVSLY